MERYSLEHCFGLLFFTSLRLSAVLPFSLSYSIRTYYLNFTLRQSYFSMPSLRAHLCIFPRVQSLYVITMTAHNVNATRRMYFGLMKAKEDGWGRTHARSAPLGATCCWPCANCITFYKGWNGLGAGISKHGSYWNPQNWWDIESSFIRGATVMNGWRRARS